MLFCYLIKQCTYVVRQTLCVMIIRVQCSCIALLIKLLLLLLTDSQERVVRRFSPAGVFNYTSLLLSQSKNTLYVGARDTLFALNVNDITSHTQQKNVCMCDCVAVYVFVFVRLLV